MLKEKNVLELALTKLYDNSTQSSLLVVVRKQNVYFRIQMIDTVQEGDAPSGNVTAATNTAVTHLSLYGQ